jgi:hypothetical protein
MTKGFIGCYIVAKPDYSESKIVLAMVKRLVVQYLQPLIERNGIGRTSCKRKVVSKQQAHDLPEGALLLIINEVIIDDYPSSGWNIM